MKRRDFPFSYVRCKVSRKGREEGREVFRCMRAIWDGGLREQRNPRVDKFTGVRIFSV